MLDSGKFHFQAKNRQDSTFGMLNVTFACFVFVSEKDLKQKQREGMAWSYLCVL